MIPHSIFLDKNRNALECQSPISKRLTVWKDCGFSKITQPPLKFPKKQNGKTFMIPAGTILYHATVSFEKEPWFSKTCPQGKDGWSWFTPSLDHEDFHNYTHVLAYKVKKPLYVKFVQNIETKGADYVRQWDFARSRSSTPTIMEEDKEIDNDDVQYGEEVMFSTPSSRMFSFHTPSREKFYTPIRDSQSPFSFTPPTRSPKKSILEDPYNEEESFVYPNINESLLDGYIGCNECEVGIKNESVKRCFANSCAACEIDDKHIMDHLDPSKLICKHSIIKEKSKYID
jgi:hypothetical protein